MNTGILESPAMRCSSAEHDKMRELNTACRRGCDIPTFRALTGKCRQLGDPGRRTRMLVEPKPRSRRGAKPPRNVAVALGSIPLQIVHKARNGQGAVALLQVLDRSSQTRQVCYNVVIIISCRRRLAISEQLTHADVETPSREV